MNEFLLSSPLLNILDLIAAILFVLQAFMVICFFGLNEGKIKFREEGYIIQSFGYLLTAIILLFKIWKINVPEHSLFEQPGPFMLLMICQFYSPAFLSYYYMISGRSFLNKAIILTAILSFFNIFLIIYREFCNPDILIYMSVAVLFGIIAINVFFYSKTIKMLANREIDSDPEFRSTLFMFFITGAFTFMSLLLYNLHAVRLLFYILFIIYILTTMGYLTAVIMYRSLSTRICTTQADAPYDENTEEHMDYQISNNPLLEEERFSELRKRLFKYLEEEKPYLKSNLTIGEVSMYLYTNKTYLSKVINSTTKQNFNQLINCYRVEEAKRIFYSKQDVSMDELCTRSGFGSMASFTIAFRVFTNTSPSDWCKEQRVRLRNEAKAIS